MSLGGTIRLAGRSAVRHPRTTWRRVSGQKLKAFVRLLDAAPAPARRGVGSVLNAGARVLLRRRSDDPVGAPLHVVAAWASGHAREALAWAEALAVAPATDARTALRLANASLALGEVEPARRIVEALASAGRGDDAATLTVRADVALRTGRYRAAAELAGRAVEAAARSSDSGSRASDAGGAGRGAGRARAILGAAEGELRVLQPGWRPSLDAAAPRGPLAPVRGRVLHLLTNSLPYREAGYTVRTQSIARSQLDVGLDPHLATRAGFPLVDGVAGAPRSEMIEGVPYHRLLADFEPGSGPDVLTTATARAAARLVHELRPAVLHPASNFLNAQVALALRDRFGIPVVYEVRGFLEETWAARTVAGGGSEGGVEEADRYRGAKEAETACMLAADAIVTLSDTMRAEMIARGCDPASLVVIPNAVDIERFEPRPRDAALAATLGIEPGETVVGYVSTLNRMEGIGTLLQAAAILLARGRPIRVLLVGDGEDRGALQARAAEPDLAGRVIFTGRVPHDRVTAYYSLIDVFVVPRTADRVSQLVTPLKPFEAMALQRTLVVSDVAALKEIVTDGETGHTFRAGDATNLADVVEPLLGDPLRRAELGAAAREWVAANRTWRQNGLRYRELYERLGVA